MGVGEVREVGVNEGIKLRHVGEKTPGIGEVRGNVG